MTLASAALAVGGYLGLRDHRVSQHLNAENAAAVSAAKECVAATQVPASDDMVAAEQKILECATGQFYAQAVQNAGFFVHAFKMGQVHTEVAEIRAAAERDNPDGSVDVLVAFRVKVDNVEAKGKEYGYRLRAQMVSVNGAYRIADLQQVSR
ncbi:Mce protein [Mycobacterium sp. M1]|uniref:Mce protein n=1 Tax=Mycolicibacter acidiphilus TaxID=2835306 RepID=A0ABS5RQA2_9MYCO|nr:Mce protein [Mycolicibacter acidiphilus]